jgi:hypothetical protein
MVTNDRSEPVSRRAFLGGIAAAGATLALQRTTVPSFAGTSPTWTELTPAASPPARSDHGLAFDPATDLVYLFGGQSDFTALNDLWTFDAATATWTEIEASGDLPPPRFTPITFFDTTRNALVVSTGQGDSFLNDTWAFDPTVGTWRELGATSEDRPARRYGAAGAFDTAGDRFIVTHGFTFRGRFDDTWTFSLEEERWTKLDIEDEVPIKRCLTQAAWDADGNRLYMFGGQTNGDPYLGDLWSLSVEDANWRKRRGRPKPSPRNLYGSAFDAVSRRWFVYAGDTDDGRVGDMWAYDVAAKAWSRFGARARRPARRRSPAIVVAGDRIVLFGGRAGGDLNDTWTLALA